MDSVDSCCAGQPGADSLRCAGRRAGRAPAAEPAATTAAPAEGAAAPSGEVKDFITWYQYDEKNEDPASDETVGNQYLRDTIPVFNEAFAGKWNWVNQPKAWDKMAAELVAAVQAGGDVPDLFEMGGDWRHPILSERRLAGSDGVGQRPAVVRGHG